MCKFNSELVKKLKTLIFFKLNLTKLIYCINTCRVMVFIKAVKCLSFSVALIPLTGCALAIGIIFGSLVKAESFNPDLGNILFNRAMLGFALVETYLVIVIVILGLIYGF